MEQEIRVVDLEEKFGQFTGQWQPKVIGVVNEMHVKLARIQGAFEFHHHDTEDELFYVVKGQFEMHLRDKILLLREGQMTVIPHGVEHKPVAHEECWIMMFEPGSTINSGTIESDRTYIPDWI